VPDNNGILKEMIKLTEFNLNLINLGADPWYQHQQRPNRPALGSVPFIGKTDSMNLNVTNLNELNVTNLNEFKRYKFK
jgi:hypothetical protein